MRITSTAVALLASALIVTPALAQNNVMPSNPAASGGNLPTSGTQNGMGSPSGTGIGTEGNSSLIAPGGGNGFQNNTSLNGSSSNGTPGIGGAVPSVSH